MRSTKQVSFTMLDAGSEIGVTAPTVAAANN